MQLLFRCRLQSLRIHSSNIRDRDRFSLQHDLLPITHAVEDFTHGLRDGVFRV